MYTLEEKTPAEGEVVIGYLPDGYWGLFRYKKARIWFGKPKMRFVSLPKGFINDSVIGWNHVPTRNDTF